MGKREQESLLSMKVSPYLPGISVFLSVTPVCGAALQSLASRNGRLNLLG